MENFLEKVASELDKAADYIEKHETADYEIKEKEAAEKAAAENKKREEIFAPLKEKLASVADEDEINERLKDTPTETLELIGKSLLKESAELEKESKDSTITDDWGHVEMNKDSGKAKYAGYKDPIEAFAMGD